MSWRETASAQDAVITRRQLSENGLAHGAISRMLAGRSLQVLSRGVFLVGGAPLTYRARLWAAVLATDGVLGFFTAARLWGVLELDELPVHVVLPHDRRVYPPRWVRLHRVPVASYGRASVDGLPVTARSWTLLDCLPKLAPADRSRIADRAVQRGWLRRADIARRLRDYPGRTGNTALRELAAQLSDGAAAHSERVLHRLLRQAGITGWRPNFPVWAGGELIGVVDVALPAKRIAIEIDGWAYHSDVDRFRRDRARQNDLIMHGWTVLRFTWADLAEQPGYVRAMVSRAAAA